MDNFNGPADQTERERLGRRIEGGPGPLDYYDQLPKAADKERAELEAWAEKERKEQAKQAEERKKKQEAREKVAERQIGRIDGMLETCSIDYILPLVQAKKILMDEIKPPRILVGDDSGKLIF